MIRVFLRVQSKFNGSARLKRPISDRATAVQRTSLANALSLVVVVLVPIALRVPAVLVFIPPPMTLPPATRPRIVQFPALVICQPAVRSVSPDCLVEFMFCVSDPALTSVEGFCLNA
jgi:hypothetical protein